MGAAMSATMRMAETAKAGMMKRAARLAAGMAATLMVVMLAACGEAPDDQPVAERAPSFDLLSFFEGTSCSKGTVTTAFFFDESFTAAFSGQAEGRRLMLDERFTFKDGKRLQHWDLAEPAPGHYAGTVTTELKTGMPAPAVPVEGHATANGAVLDYQGYAPGGGETLLHFRHVLTENADGTVANHVTVSKYYLPLATSDVTFAKSLGALDDHWDRLLRRRGPLRGFRRGDRTPTKS